MDNVHGVCVRMTSVGMHTKEHHHGVNALDVDADVGMLCHALPCSALLGSALLCTMCCCCCILKIQHINRCHRANGSVCGRWLDVAHLLFCVCASILIQWLLRCPGRVCWLHTAISVTLTLENVCTACRHTEENVASNVIMRTYDEYAN